MHYIFDRRLNMLDIRLNELDEKDLYDDNTRETLIKEHRIEIPDLVFDKLSHEVKKEKITYDNMPKGFSYTPNEEYEYIVFKIPFNKDEFVSDLFENGEKDQGYYINNATFFYKEYSSEKLKDNAPLINEIEKKAIEKSNKIQEKIDGYQREARKFNDEILPAEVDTRMIKEKDKRRMRQSLEKSGKTG